MRASPGSSSACTVVAAVLSAGCATYSVPIDRNVRQGELSARIESGGARPMSEVRVALVLERAPSGMTLSGAAVNASSPLRCSGIVATRLARSSGLDAAQPLLNHERLVLEFPVAALTPLAEASPRLDLTLDTGRGAKRCYALALTEPGRRLT